METWINSNTQLNTEQQSQLIDILTKRCGAKKTQRVTSLVKYAFSDIADFLTRFYIDNETQNVHYCAGQSYPCEIKSIREGIVKRFP